MDGDGAIVATLSTAIASRRGITFAYKGSIRTADPYILGRDGKGKLMLSAVQHRGGSGKGFRTYDVAEMRHATVGAWHFSPTHPDYNAADPYFEQIVRQV